MRRPLFLVTDLERGGTPTVIREITTRLFRKNIPVAVGCLSTIGVTGEEIASAGVPVFGLGAKSAFDLSIFVKLRKKLREYDGVFSFLVHANAAARFASLFTKIPVIQSIQTTQPYPKWHWMLQKFLALGSRGVIVPSPSAADVAHRWAWFPKRKIRVIPNGVDFSKVVERPKGMMCPPHIGFIGRLDPIKCVPNLIEALTLLSEGVHLHIFGDGPDRQRIEDRIAELHRSYQVTLHGMVSSPYEALPQIDILVLPSQAEGFGMVLIEAMAAGVNVVGTRVPGITDIVEHEKNGLLANWNDPADLANQIRRLIEDEPLATRLADTAKQEAREKYDWDRIVMEYEKVIREN